MFKIKSQKIFPIIPDDSSKASFLISSQDLSDYSHDWEFFVIVDYQAKQSLSTKVVQNLLTDITSHNLIFDLDQPVLQVLEKSLKEIKEALQKMQNDLLFNAVAAVFKDDFVYVSIYGDSKALYLDGTQVVHVNTEKEGKYAGTSQKIEDGKVMVICTREFFAKFPPKSLTSLTKPILSQDLDELSSAVIIKVDLEKEAPTIDKQSAVVKESSPRWKITVKNKKLIKSLIIGALVLLLGVSGFAIYRGVKSKPKNPAVNEVKPTAFPEVEFTENPGIQGELTKKLDEANKVKRVKTQVFYDISITDAKTSPSEMALSSKYIAVSDRAQGKIYFSGRDVSKFEEFPQIFPGAKNLLFEGDTLIFTDNEGVKFYSIATKSVSKSFLADAKYPTIGSSSEYLGFTYALSGDSLVKFTKTGNKLIGTLWAQKPEFANGVSVDIDGSIYVLFSNGSLEKYTGGIKDDFSIVGLDKPVQKPLKVLTNADYKQIYVGDGEEGRIIAFDTDGVLDFQIKPELGSEWLDLRSFDISTDEKTFFVLSGTKVYEFTL